MSSRDQKNYFLTLDLGTTSTRAHVIDKNFVIKSCCRFESKLVQSNEGISEISEIEPNSYFNEIVTILRDSLKLASVGADEIIALGISVQV